MHFFASEPHGTRCVCDSTPVTERTQARYDHAIESMLCDRCDGELRGDERQCPQCGAAIDWTTPQSVTAREWSNADAEREQSRDRRLFDDL